MSHSRAKNIAKQRYGRQCVFSGIDQIDGAHIWPAGPYPELSDEPDNIVPITRRLHSYSHASFDWTAGGMIRPISEKLWLLLNLSLPEVRSSVRHQIEQLGKIVIDKGLEFPVVEEPADYGELLNGMDYKKQTVEAM